MESIHIYHTNDIHSDLSSWPTFQRLMPQWRQASLSAGASAVYLFDSGDAIDYRHSLMQASRGQAMVDLMNDLNYDAVTLGNNEGLNVAQADLDQVYAKAQFDIIISNLQDLHSHQLPAWAQSFKTYVTPHHHRLGVLGLTYPYKETYLLNGWQVMDPMPILKEAVSLYADQVDALILLSHLGLDDDQAIGQSIGGLDAIIGGHTHHVLDQGQVIHDCLLTGAGSHGRYVGRIELDFENGQLKDKRASLIPLEPYVTEEDKKRAQAYQSQGDWRLDQAFVCQLDRQWSKKADPPWPLADLAHHAFQQRAGRQVSILLSGLFVTDLGPGRISQLDLHDCLPHSMRLLDVSMQGRDVKTLVKDIENKRPLLKDLSVRGSGFRGKVLGDVLYDGLAYDAESQELTWLGQRIGDSEYYDFVTVDFMLFSSFFPIIKEKAQTCLLYTDLLRQVMGDYLKNHR